MYVKECVFYMLFASVSTGVSPGFRENIFVLGLCFELNLFNVVDKTDLTVRATKHAKLRLSLCLKKT